ncbi:MAG: SDR family NAD(P)-dependent oxidoreductase [Lewinellaceae bacterium]|nr:SDR family NAD(P)-dependent oxidoreductase [Lewinellaceae bacterium]
MKDKVVIITGSNMGIGKAIARHLGALGASVVLNGRDAERLSQACDQLREEGMEVSGFPADIADPESCRQLIAHAVKKYGHLDILINNAAISAKGFFEDTRPEVFKQSVDVNILGAMYATREALPHIKATKGQILFISGLAGLRGMPFQGTYCMTKMAQTALAESLRAELYHSGVHAGIVYVGITKNDPTKKVVFNDGTWRPLPERTHRFASTQDRVAKVVTRALERRRFKTTVGWDGKMYLYVSRFAPWLLDLVFRNNIDKFVEHDT